MEAVRYFSDSSGAAVGSSFVVGRSEIIPARALIRFGLALVLPPVAASPVRAVAADVPFSLPAAAPVSPALLAAGCVEPGFFFVFLIFIEKIFNKIERKDFYCGSTACNAARSCSNRSFSSFSRCSLDESTGK